MWFGWEETWIIVKEAIHIMTFIILWSSSSSSSFVFVISRDKIKIKTFHLTSYCEFLSIFHLIFHALWNCAWNLHLLPSCIIERQDNQRWALLMGFIMTDMCFSFLLPPGLFFFFCFWLSVSSSYDIIYSDTYTT